MRCVGDIKRIKEVRAMYEEKVQLYEKKLADVNSLFSEIVTIKAELEEQAKNKLKYIFLTASFSCFDQVAERFSRVFFLGNPRRRFTSGTLFGRFRSASAARSGRIRQRTPQ